LQDISELNSKEIWQKERHAQHLREGKEGHLKISLTTPNDFMFLGKILTNTKWGGIAKLNEHKS